MLELVKSLDGHSEDRVWHLSWSSDGTHLASCGEDRVVRIWTAEANKWEEAKCIATLEEGTQTRTLRCCEWSPNNKKIATASFCGIVAIWETQNSSRTVWDQIASLEGHENEVKSVSWNADGRYLTSCGRDKKIWVWEDIERSGFECICILEGHSQDVKFVQWHSFENVFFSASYDDTIKVWVEDEEEWYCSDTLVGHTSTVWSLVYSEKSSRLFSCSDDMSIICWESTNKQLSKWSMVYNLSNVHSQAIYSIDCDRKSDTIAAAGGDNAISLIVAVNEERILKVLEKQEQAHDADVNCVR